MFKNNMFNSKYSKTLTIILIVVIIAIIGLLIYFGIDVYRKFYVEDVAGDAVEDFQNRVTSNVIIGGNDGSPIISNDVNPNVNINDLNLNVTIGDNNTNNNTDDNNDDKPTYKGFDMIGTIEIPAIDIEYPIIPEYQNGLNALNVGIVVLYPANKDLNEVGNIVLAGHNYRNGTFFSNNKRLEEGDSIYITDLSGERVEYKIYKKYVTSTGDSAYMNRDTEGRREISLTTCTDDTSQRLIIWAAEA